MGWKTISKIESMGSQMSKSEQVCTDICQQTTANPETHLHLCPSLSISLSSPSNGYLQHPQTKKGGRRGNMNKQKEHPTKNPRQEIQFLNHQ
jgi:hypothetical protein